MRKLITFYMHTSKDSNYEKGQDMNLSQEALEVFVYTGYEIRIDAEVDIKTGIVYAKVVQGVPLEREVRI